jgi:DNA-binding CsgD family transcriptional regulator
MYAPEGRANALFVANNDYYLVVNSLQQYPDRIERLTLLAQSLVTDPSWDEVTRLLALRILDFWGCQEVYLFEVHSGGSLKLKASYGVADTTNFSEISLAASPELGSVLSYGRTTWIVDAAKGDNLIPSALGSHHNGGVVIAPLNRVNIPEFLMIATFADTLPDNPASGPFMSSVVSLLELRVAMAEGGSARRVVAGSPASNVDFSERQQRILERIQDGKTNKSIARELGFSESTIRQETLRLYRSLGVNSRTDAVIAAQAKGLLTS